MASYHFNHLHTRGPVDSRPMPFLVPYSDAMGDLAAELAHSTILDFRTSDQLSPEERRERNIQRLQQEERKRQEVRDAVDELLAAPLVEVPEPLLGLIGAGEDYPDFIGDNPVYRLWLGSM